MEQTRRSLKLRCFGSPGHSIRHQFRGGTQLRRRKLPKTINKLNVQADITEMQGIHGMQTAANANSKFAAALSGSARPIIAYAFMLLFLAIKGLAAWQVYNDIGLDWSQMMTVVWDQETQILWSAIISFYFGHRAMQNIRTL